MENTTTKHASIKGWARPLLILIPYILIVGIFQTIAFLIMGLDPRNYKIEQTPLQSLVVSLFLLIGTIVVIGIFLRYIDKKSFRSLGFYREGIREELIIGFSLGAIIMTVGFIFLNLLGEIHWVGISLEPYSFIFGFLLFVSVAIGEELLMRGYILNNLMLSMNRMVALLVSSVLFSLMHVFNSNFSWICFCNILLAGILLGMPYIYTKSLWLPIALHFSWNFFQGTIFGFNVSGHVEYSLIHQSYTTENIWNGGLFGFEGSALALVFQVIAILVLWRYYSQKENIVTLNPVTIPSA